MVGGGFCNYTPPSFRESKPTQPTSPSGQRQQRQDLEHRDWRVPQDAYRARRQRAGRCFTTDPTRIVAGGSDKTARLWSVGSKLRRWLAYTLEDWGLCKHLKAAVWKLAPETLGKPATVELLGNLGTRSEGGGRCRLTASTAATTGAGC